MRLMGSITSFTCSTSSARPSRLPPLLSSCAVAQEAGTSNFLNAVAPMSMALWFMSTMSWPFFR